MTDKPEKKSDRIEELTVAMTKLENKLYEIVATFELEHCCKIEDIEVDRITFTAMNPTDFPPRIKLCLSYYAESESMIRTIRIK